MDKFLDHVVRHCVGARPVGSFIAVSVLGLILTMSPCLLRAEEPHEFTVTAGNTFFDQTPQIGSICTFDFGDPLGGYNVLVGYNAAHIYQKPGTYSMKLTRAGQPPTIKTIRVLPDHRAIQALDQREGLMDLIRGLQNDSVVLLAPGTTWDLAGPIEIKARNIEFRASGPGPAPRIRKVASKASNSLVCVGMDITFRGIEFDSDRDMQTVGNAKVNIRGVTPETAHVTFVNCIFRNVDDAIFCTALTRGVLVQGCTFTDEVRSCDIWCDGSNLVVLGNKMATSQREHNIRCSTTAFFNLLVDDNDMTATHGKETLTFRAGEDLFAARNAFHGWVRIGPGPRGDGRKMTAQEIQKNHVWYAVIARNAFLDGAHLQLNEGIAGVSVVFNRLDVDTSHVPIHVQGPNVVETLIADNFRVLTAGPSEKPIIRALETNPGDWIDRNNTDKTAAEAAALKGK